MMKNFDEKSLLYALNLSKSRYNTYLNANDFEDIKKRILRLIHHAPFQEILQHTHWTKEQALMYKNEVRIIDLLVYGENRCYIFDYKTTQDELDEHIVQVNHYKNAIKTIFPTYEVLGYILYLRSDNTFIKAV
jgi:exodeoxyribonuclease V beta subunit